MHAMTFVNVSLLAGAALIAIPIVLDGGADDGCGLPEVSDGMVVGDGLAAVFADERDDVVRGDPHRTGQGRGKMARQHPTWPTPVVSTK